MSDEQRRVESLPEAVVAVITKESKVLLIQRSPDVLGAAERQDRSPRVRPARKVWENIAASGSHKLHWWLAEWVSGDFKLDPREVADARWLGVDEVLRLERTFERDREFFKRVFPLL